MEVMIPKLFVLLGCAALTCVAQSQKVFPYEYSQEDLPNGLRLITMPTDYPNIVSTYIVVQTGSRNEVEPGKTRLRAPVRAPDVSRHREVSRRRSTTRALKRTGAASNAFTTTTSLRITRPFRRKTWTAMLDDGGRPLSESEVYAGARVQDGDAGGAGRVQQEQRGIPLRSWTKCCTTRRSTSTPTSTPPWVS